MANQAQGSLGVVQDFVNTLDVEEGAEELREPEHLCDWLVQRSLLDRRETGGASASDLTAALELREALRRLLVGNNGGPRLAADSAVLDRVALNAGLRLRFETAASRVTLTPAASGVPAALGRLVAMVAEAMSDGSWERLKACAEHTCQWAFYDRTKNHSGHWCQMAVCGNRSKARQFRQRRRGAGAALS